MTSSLEVNYEVADINGNASNYRLWKNPGSAPQIVASTTNASLRNVTAQGLTNLTAGWGISERLNNITISGSVLTSGGAGIRNAIVTLSGGNLPAPLVFQTGNFGIYSFSNIEAGYEYTVHVSAKRQRFATTTHVIIPTANITDLNFVANPSE
jgi:hypothetical protein